MAVILFLSIITKINFWFSGGHERTVQAKKNISLSFIIKIVNTIANFALVPLTLGFLDETRYGIWLILSSILTWFSFLDFGLGNGLKNKLAEALAKNDKNLASIYVSTTYGILGIISLIYIAVISIIFPFLHWSTILNTSANLNNELSWLAYSLFFLFGLRLFLQPITFIIDAHQKYAINQLINMLSNVLSLIVIYLLTVFYKGANQLLICGIVISINPVLMFLTASIYGYKTRFRDFIPSFKRINFSYNKTLLTLGIKFFIINLASIILFTTDNMIITQIFSPDLVTIYSIPHKYFGIILIFFTIVVGSLWPAYTEAFHKQDFDWIRRAIKKQIKLYIAFCGLIIIMVLLSDILYDFWVGSYVIIPQDITIFMALFFAVQLWNMIFAFVMNGIGKLNIQLYYCIGAMIINIPLSVFLAKNLGFGIAGVIFATTLCQLVSAILLPIQYHKIISKQAKGIWNA